MEIEAFVLRRLVYPPLVIGSRHYSTIRGGVGL